MAFDLRKAIYEGLGQPETKSELVDYFREHFPSNWRQRLAEELSQEGAGKAKSLERRFQGSRAESERVGKKAQAEYRRLGEKLPPNVPENGIRISGTLCIKYSEECEEREIDISLTYAESKALVKDISLQSVVNLYNEEAMDEEEPEGKPCSGDDCSTNLVVEPIE